MPFFKRPGLTTWSQPTHEEQQPLAFAALLFSLPSSACGGLPAAPPARARPPRRMLVEALAPAAALATVSAWHGSALLAKECRFIAGDVPLRARGAPSATPGQVVGADVRWQSGGRGGHVRGAVARAWHWRWLHPPCSRRRRPRATLGGDNCKVADHLEAPPCRPQKGPLLRRQRFCSEICCNGNQVGRLRAQEPDQVCWRPRRTLLASPPS